MRNSVNQIDTGTKHSSTPPSAKVPDTPVTDTNLPIHYDRIRAARENWKRVTVMGGPPGMTRKWAQHIRGALLAALWWRGTSGTSASLTLTI